MRFSVAYTAIAAIVLGALRVAFSPAIPASVGQTNQPGVSSPSRVATRASRDRFAGGCNAFEPIPDAAKTNAAHSLPEDDTQAAATLLLQSFFGKDFSESYPATIRYAIALAPDPVHTNLSLLFDREMVTVQQAAQDEGYTYNSSWLPWHSRGSSRSASKDSESQSSRPSQREACPGLILFRRSVSDTPQSTKSPYTDGLLVFVVGEQPTGGLNEDQWANAISFLATHSAAHPADPTLRILGPSFSGSLVSLERNLENLYVTSGGQPGLLNERFPNVRVLSGSVRSCASIVWFQDQLHDARFKGAVRFGSFQENDAVQIERLLRYLTSQHGSGKDAAILAEDETAYANNYVDQPHAQTADKPVEYTPPCEFPYNAETQPLRLSYPRDISALRNAYQQQSIFSTTTPTERTAHTILQDTDSQGPDTSTDTSDTIPTFSGELTPVAQEAVLYSIVSYLRAHHTRYLLLRCSNQLDFLFLTRFFHRAYPEGRIITVGADALFRREIDSTEFRGVMALSTYPLLPRDQHWSALFTADPFTATKRHTHRVFEDQSQQGQYIAARYLLGLDPLGSDSDKLPFRPYIPGLADPYWLFPADSDLGTTHAPTWLSVVGRDGYWPVAVLDDKSLVDEQSEKMSDKPPYPPPPTSTIVQLTKITDHLKYDKDRSHTGILFNPPLSWRIVTSLAMFLLIYQIIAMRYGSQHAAMRLLAGFRKVTSAGQSFLVALNCSFVLMLLLTPLSVVLFLPNRDDLAPDLVTLDVGLMMALVGTLVLVWLLRRYSRGASLAFLVSLASLIAIALTVLCLSKRIANDMPLALRTAALTSGVSPLVPVLFLLFGFYLWSWQTMAGNALLCSGHPELPRQCHQQVHLGWRRTFAKLRGWSNSRIDCSDSCLRTAQYQLSNEVGRRILHVAAPFALPLPVLIPTLFLFVVAVFYFHKELPLLTMESHSFTAALNVALLIAFLLTIAESARLYATWTELHRLLGALNQTRLRRTFARLRAIDAHSLWSVSGNVRRIQSMFFSQQLDAAARLVLAIKEPRPNLRSAVLFGRQFESVNASQIESGPNWETPISVIDADRKTTIRELFADAVGETLNEILLPAWKNEDESLSIEAQRPAKSDLGSDENDDGAVYMELSHDPAVRAAEEFVCFHYIIFIQNILARMRTMTFSMAALFVTVCFAISFYPFVPRTEIGLWMIADLTLIGIAVLSVYAGMERNATLSFITNTKPGHLSSSFWLKSAGFLAAPVLGILTTQFPAIADSVLAWVQPGLDAISK